MILPDVTGDQKPDLITSDSNSTTIAIRPNDGAGGFANGLVNLNVGMQPTSLVVADLTGDGIPDIVVANQGGGTISVLVGQGSGAFGLQTAFTMNTQSASVGVGDFNRDGLIDVATNSYDTSNVTVRLNVCN